MYTPIIMCYCLSEVISITLAKLHKYLWVLSPLKETETAAIFDTGYECFAFAYAFVYVFLTRARR